MMPDFLPCSLYAEPETFSSLCDEELVRLAKRGNHFAAERIVNRYRGFVKARCRSYFLAGADREDLIQEGMIGLYKAVLSYDSEKGTGFKTFAELCVTRQIISAVKMAARQKHMPLNSYISLDKDTDSADCFAFMGCREKDSVNPEQIMIERENMVGIEGRIDRALSAFEAEVLLLYIGGLSYGQIAKRMGREAKSIDNALQRIKRKLEKLLL